MTSPLSIYQRALDAVSAAVMADDFAAYLAMLDLPYLIRTQQADFVLNSAAELEPTFRALGRGLVRRGVTHYERVAREASFQRADRIVGRHHTHMIRHAERIAAPHLSTAALVRREGGVWRFTEASYPMSAAAWPPTDRELFSATPAAGQMSTGLRQ
jgi:hypothetical protein